MEKSGVLCVGMCHRLPCAISVYCRFLVDAHAKFWIGLHAAEQREYVQRNVKLCRHAPEHEHTAPQWCAPLYSCLLSGWCWGKGLVAGRRSWRWDFMANAEIGPLVKERGLTEVQKQREHQMNTVDKQRDNMGQLHREKRNCMFCLSVKKSPKQEISTDKTEKNCIQHKAKKKVYYLLSLFSFPCSPPDLHAFELSICLCW